MSSRHVDATVDDDLLGEDVVATTTTDGEGGITSTEPVDNGSGPFANPNDELENGTGDVGANGDADNENVESGLLTEAGDEGKRLVLSATKEGVPEIDSVPKVAHEDVDNSGANVHSMVHNLAASTALRRTMRRQSEDDTEPVRDQEEDIDPNAEAVVAPAVASPSEEAVDCRPEDEKDIEWRLRKKHVFILNSAGRPIFTRHGDESDFVDLFGIFQVLVSMASAASLCGPDGAGEIDCLRRISAGPHHTLHFQQHGELIYVMVTRTAESPKACVRQLKLFHSQIVSVLPTANAILKRNASYDIRRMFSTADVNVLKMLIKRTSTEPIYHFRAMHAVALLPDMRKEVDTILKSHRVEDDHMFSLLVHDLKVVSIVTPPKAPVHPDDMLLLLNFTNCLARTQSGVCWAPICLPKFNDTGYLWCYCSNVSIACREEILRTGGTLPAMKGPGEHGMPTVLDGQQDPMDHVSGEKGILLVMIGTGQEMFGALEKAGQSIISLLSRNSLFAEIEYISSYATLIPFDAALAVEDKMNPPLVLWYTLVSETGQLISSTVSPMIAFSKTTKKHVLRQWVKMKDKLSQASTATNPVMIATIDDLSYLVVRQRGLGDVYGVFLPSMGKTDMLRWATRWCKWAREREKTYTIVKSVTW